MPTGFSGWSALQQSVPLSGPTHFRNLSFEFKFYRVIGGFQVSINVIASAL